MPAVLWNSNQSRAEILWVKAKSRGLSRFFFFSFVYVCVRMWAHIFNFSVEPKFSSEDYSENKKNKFFFKFSTQAQPWFLNQLLH